jgi:hypothetical protein
VGLIFVADRWAWSLLAVRVALVVGGDELFMIFGALCTILGAVHEWPSIRFFGSINNRVPGIDFPILPFCNLL